MPGRQIQYLSAAPPALWQTIYVPYVVISSLIGPLRRYHPGEQVTENWNRYPLHPTPNSSLTGAGFFPVLGHWCAICALVTPGRGCFHASRRYRLCSGVLRTGGRSRRLSAVTFWHRNRQAEGTPPAMPRSSASIPPPRRGPPRPLRSSTGSVARSSRRPQHTGVTAFVGSQTAAGIDTSVYLSSRLPWVIGMVVLLAFCLLVVVFQSIAIPVNAAAMNLLPMGAAYGRHRRRLPGGQSARPLERAIRTVERRCGPNGQRPLRASRTMP
jgi:hypothetical protein